MVMPMDQSPHTERGRATKARIVAAAATLIHRSGVAATAVDDVLAAAGAGKSQFYHYFHSKEDLVGAVIDHQVAGVLASQAAFDLSTWQGLEAWSDAFGAGQEETRFVGCPLGSIVAEVGNREGRLQTLAAAAFERWEAALATGLSELQARGGLQRSADPSELAQVALATIQGGYLLASTRKSNVPLRRAARAAYAQLRLAAA